MPKIRWKDLPPALRDDLFERLRERKISAEDLYELKLWRESEPEAPEAAGTRTSAPSRSVARENTQRRSCSAVSRPGAGSCSRRQAPRFSASNVQGRFLRCHAPGVTPSISLNTRAKWLCSANPVASATSASELAPSLSMI
jgi:hypothetical protein